MKFASLVFTLLILCCSGTQKTTTTQKQGEQIEHVVVVDTFQLDNYTVEVIFYEPLHNIALKYPNFKNLDSRGQADAWVKTFEKSLVYTFLLREKDGAIFRAYNFRGKENASVDARAFVVNSVDREYFIKGQPGNTSGFILNTYKTSIHNYLFEHMNAFQNERGKEVIGNGIQFFPGIFMRVVPYSEVKDQVVEIIKKDLNN